MSGVHWQVGTVVRTLRQRPGVQELLVNINGAEAKAVHYTDTLPEAGEGDEVLLNTTAVDLGLGTGGQHFICALRRKRDPSFAFARKREEAGSEVLGHIMKLRYTPLQRRVLAVEEEASPYHHLFQENSSLEGLPVLIGELHSMLPVVLCWLKFLGESGRAEPLRTVYVMTEGGALPLRFSRHAALLRESGWLHGTVTCGHAYGGDLEAVNKFSGLLAASLVLRAEVAVAVMGPGIVGTRTVWGHTGIEVGEIANAVHILGGQPVIIPRLSFADKRWRHAGLSHHLLTVLSRVVMRPAVLPLPADIPSYAKSLIMRQLEDSRIGQMHRICWIPGIHPAEIQSSLETYPEKITTMGRTLQEDPLFFQGVVSAAQYVWQLALDRRNAVSKNP